MFTSRRIEVPTLLLGLVIYLGWATVTYFFHALPLAVGIALGAFLIAWHGSLQHEACHGHPTKSRRFNAGFAGVSLWLYLPFPLYRSSHLAHHASPHLSSPLCDSESYFLSAADWQGLGRLRRGFWSAHNTLLGRLLLGPLVVLVRVYPAELRQILSGDTKRLRIWAVHLAIVAALLSWTSYVCGLAVHEYLLYFVYPGMSLSLLRSFAEHQPGKTQDERIALVEAHPIFALLFLNNNLHVLHHDQPGLPWFRYPARYAAQRSELLERNGGLLYRGYGEVARRFLLQPIASPAHPNEAAP